MAGKHSLSLKNQLPLIVLIVASILCIVISIFSLKSGWFIVFQNLFYIPIIISCFYYKQRGFIFSVILACIYFLLILAFAKESSIIIQAIVRVFIFIAVAGIITYLSLVHKKVKELRITNVYNRSLIEASLDPMMVVGADGKILDVNTATEAATGYPRSELIGTEFYNHFIAPDQIRAKFRDVFRACSFRNEPLEIRHRDGHVTLVLFNATLYKDEKGKVVGVFAAARDITERKRAEEELKQSEARYRTLFDDANDGIALADIETGRLVDCNQRLCQMVEWDKAELVGQAQSVLHPASAVIGSFSPTFEQHKTGDPGLSLQENLLSKNGKLTPVEIRASRIRIDNRDFLMGVFRDITNRKQSEEELKQSEERYRSIFENVQEGIFRSTPEGNIITANQALAKIFGYESPEEMITSVTDIARQLHVDPEERKKIIEMIEEHGFIKMYEAQNYRRDGIIIWISLTMQAVYDEKGHIKYYDGVVEDITSRKQKDERIRKALGATIHAIAVTVETRDPYTAGHQKRVTDLAGAIATEMNLSVDQIDGISMAATIHDLGKISVPAEILSKPTKLTDIEFSLIKTHSQSGYDILKDIDFPWPVARAVLEHHERMNGSGYPNGLTRDNILMESRILSVADVVEAMASHRPYRPSLGIEIALDEIEKNRGTLYDNAVAASCLRLFREKGYQLKL
ncbi:MAG: PAS domain S-box protein [Syntrophales bacterium]|nr:PAS domain S-box protein [Syntrophales bacterium]